MADMTTARNGQHDDDLEGLEARVRARYESRFGWPLPQIAGAEEPDDDEADDDDQDDVDKQDKPKGGDKPKDGDEDAGEKLKSALQKERDLKREAKRELRAARAQIDDLTARLEAATGSAEKVTDLEDTVADLTAQLSRYEVVAAKGLDLGDAEFLKGSTKEELESSADKLLARFGASEGGFDGGPRTTPPVKKDPAKEHGRFLGALLRGQDPADQD